MKRWMLRACVLVGLLAALSVSALAAETYAIDELEMRVTIPEGHYTATREVEAGNGVLSAYGMSKEELLAYMRRNGSYLEAVETNRRYELSVYAYDTGKEALEGLTVGELEARIEEIRAEYESAGFTWRGQELYTHSQGQFVKLSLSVESDAWVTQYMQLYVTVRDGREINLVLRKYNTALTGAEETLLRGMVDSVVFGEESPPPAAFTAEPAPPAAQEPALSAGESTSVAEQEPTELEAPVEAEASTEPEAPAEQEAPMESEVPAESQEAPVSSEPAVTEEPEDAVSAGEETDEGAATVRQLAALIVILVAVAALAVLVAVLVMKAGKRVRKNPAAPSVPTEAPPGGGMANFCRNCGNKLEPGDRFCEFCGNKISRQ